MIDKEWRDRASNLIEHVIEGTKLEGSEVSFQFLKFRRRLRIVCAMLDETDRQFIRWFSPEIGESIEPIHKLIFRAWKTSEYIGALRHVHRKNAIQKRWDDRQYRLGI